MKKHLQKKGWIVVLSAMGITFLGGITYTWSVISNGLMQEYHWTSTQASLPYTVMTVAFVIAMVIFGKLQDLKGPQLCTVVSAILAGTGMLLSAFVKSPWLMVVTFGIIGGIGFGITNVVSTPPALKWFPPEKQGLISGIVVAGAGLSPVFYSPVANYLITNLGITKTFTILGIFTLVLILLLSKNIKNPPLPHVPARPKQETAETENDLTSREMLKTASFYKLWLILAFSAAAGLMIIAHATTIAKTQANWSGGYLLVMLMALFNAQGRLAGGALSDRIGRMNTLRLIFLVQAGNMLFFRTYVTPLHLALGFAVAGFCYGAMFGIIPATTSDLFGLKYFGANYGILFTAWGLSGVIGPMSAARILDTTGTYHTAYLLAAVLLVLSIVLTFTFPTRKAQSSQKSECQSIA